MPLIPGQINIFCAGNHYFAMHIWCLAADSVRVWSLFTGLLPFNGDDLPWTQSIQLMISRNNEPSIGYEQL